MKFLDALLKPIWASHAKVVQLERDIEIVKQYAADYWLHKEQMANEINELKDKIFQLQRSIDFIKVAYKRKEAKNV